MPIQRLFPLFMLAWLFLLALLYTKASHEMTLEEKRLEQLLTARTEAFAQAEMQYALLKEQLDSLSDPVAGEFALIEELGVVPQGMRRVQDVRRLTTSPNNSATVATS